MEYSPHRIHRQQWLVSVSTAEKAFAYRKQLRDHCADTFIPLFEKAFDEASPDGRLIHIPKLEIRLKLTESDDFLETLRIELFEEITRQLKPLNTKTGQAPDSLAWEELSREQNSFGSLLHYLKQGNLPWQFPVIPSEQIAAGLKESIHANRGSLISLSISNEFSPAAFFRLFQLLAEEDTLKLTDEIIDLLSGEWKSGIRLLIRLILEAPETLFIQQSRFLLAAEFLSAAITRQDKPQPPGLLNIAARILPASGVNALQKYAASSNGQDKGWQSFPEFTEPGSTENLFHDLPLNVPAGISIPGEPWNVQAEKILSDFAGNFPADSSFPGSQVNVPSVNTVLPFAGLVLLHPFLKRFFVTTAVISENKQDISFYDLPRAAALLHFLASGRDKVYEFELGFIKILLGLDPTESLPVTEGLITASDREEAEALLISVISHWAVLKNTSADGLRSSFLQRNGLLYVSDEAWKIRMDSGPFDMLLEQLPWSFSIVKLPWMLKPLFTEWQTL